MTTCDLTLAEVLKSSVHFSLFNSFCGSVGGQSRLQLLHEIELYATLPRSLREARAGSIAQRLSPSADCRGPSASALSLPPLPPSDSYRIDDAPSPPRRAAVAASSSTSTSRPLSSSSFFSASSGSASTSSEEFDASKLGGVDSALPMHPVFAVPPSALRLIHARIAQRDFSPHLFADVRRLLYADIETDLLARYCVYRHSIAKQHHLNDDLASPDTKWNPLRTLRFWKKRSFSALERRTASSVLPDSAPSPALASSLAADAPPKLSTSDSVVSTTIRLSKSRLDVAAAALPSDENVPAGSDSNSSSTKSHPSLGSTDLAAEPHSTDDNPDDLRGFLIFSNAPADLEFEFCTRQHSNTPCQAS